VVPAALCVVSLPARCPLAATMQAAGPAAPLPCPHPEPEPEPDAAGASDPSAASATPAVVDPVLSAMVEMAKAFAQPPPFSAFGGRPAVLQQAGAGDPWSHEEATGTAGQTEATPSGAPAPQAHVGLAPPTAGGEDGTEGLADALMEQFGTAVGDLLDDEGAGAPRVGLVGPVPWAVLSSPGKAVQPGS
jgi:hypothetical protein